MVDFKKLKSKKSKSKSIDPTEIFRRLPKPEGVNDLYTSQTEILQKWFERRNEKDIVLKLHTGGGKTLVGLLMAQSTQNETGEPVLYLAPTTQLVQQTLEKADELGIHAVPYVTGKPLDEDFVNGKAIMVGTYKALFNGKSKFGLRGEVNPQNVAAVILDDAHAAFSVVRDSFTLKVKSKDNPSRYLELVDLFRKSFRDIDKLGTLEDIVSGSDYSILEVPYWAWHEQLDAVREQLKSDSVKYRLVWPLLRDQLHLCHALVSKEAFTITPILPLLNVFPTFYDAPRRIYMSATIADDSEIIRTFDVNPDSVKKALQSRSLAGISERMILIPELMSFEYEKEHGERIIKWAADKLDVGSIVLVPSDKATEAWSEVATVAKGSKEVESLVTKLQKEEIRGPVVFANRYDGMDLPGDSCRILLMNGLPSGTSDYELYRASALYGGTTITRMLAQRIEQGIGRGARGAGDHCVILLVGRDISSWVAKDANFRFLTSATRAQLDMGIEVSKEIGSLKDLAQTIQRSIDRDKDWIEYHAETLAELVDEDESNDFHFTQAKAERKAINLWSDGYHEQAIAKLEQVVKNNEQALDIQMRGWFQQLAARIAERWGNADRALDLQRQAFANNRNLIRPRILPPYRPLSIPSSQARAIAQKIGGYRLRQGFLQSFEEVVANLHEDATANRFEQALCDLAAMIGLSSERHDLDGEGPDVLWLLPERVGFVIEAKSRKKEKNALTKEQHGQLLVAAEWFASEYPEYDCVRVSVHPKNKATRAAVAGASHALTYEKLMSLVSDARLLLSSLSKSQLDIEMLEVECNRLLESSTLRSDRIAKNYLVPFEICV
ncbi:DEAD/DEAH box helicase family protein [Virgibacillus proomii]|uniref:DEAD/DEAH box helicase family protein n=1 Tax=Virgibacillus proomii TaxID=84407 RepID=UPI001C0FE0CF|nr:DEAD/DEAH box helicase [Virgibacillus proomii]MBU5267594.1 DEAD/DEAH box helicase [Virgibacillus proomii]